MVGLSTTAKGDGFRDKVTDLLRISGLDPKVELLIGSKKVDIYFEDRHLGRKRRYAVEAKNYARPLLAKDLQNIIGSYSNLLDRYVDEILVVSQHPVTAAAANRFLEDEPRITHQTFSQLQESLLRFEPFLRSFLQRHDEGGLESYFVPPRLEDGSELIAFLDAWLVGGSDRPVAIVAGYGMGKTSLAQHLTFRLATRSLAGGTARVPVLVSLGGISREQGLEGLIATTLTGSHPAVINFSFPLFMELNRAGRFLVILDGFDEMKHMMSEVEFRANFAELNRLVDGKARVLLLGRPTAFLSESEQEYVLRGKHRFANQLLRMPGTPDYRDLRLELFSPDQVQTFLGCYFKLQHERGAVQGDDVFIARRLQELQSSEHEKLMSRPVHARMLAELATDPAFELGRLSRFQLYDAFVNHLIDREAQKPGRGTLLRSVDRRAFSQDLAWHLWVQPSGSTLGCRLEDLPSAIFEPYLPEDEDLTTVRRALLSGSFLDEKSAGVFYFAHRSFQEFLVAEYIWNNVAAGAESSAIVLNELEQALTRDVFAFLVEREDREFFRGMLGELTRRKASYPIDTVAILGSSDDLQEIAANKGPNNITAWDATILLVGAAAQEFVVLSEVVRVAEQIAAKAQRRPGVRMAAIAAILLLLDYANLDQETAFRSLISLMFANAQEDLGLLGRESGARRKPKGESMRDGIFEAVSAEMDDDKGLVISLVAETLYDHILESAPLPIQAPSFEARLHRLVYEAPFAEFFDRVPDASRQALYEFFSADARTAAVVAPGTRRERASEREFHDADDPE